VNHAVHTAQPSDPETLHVACLDSFAAMATPTVGVVAPSSSA
jgi:hypothetical protein